MSDRYTRAELRMMLTALDNWELGIQDNFSKEHTKAEQRKLERELLCCQSAINKTGWRLAKSVGSPPRKEENT